MLHYQRGATLVRRQEVQAVREVTVSARQELQGCTRERRGFEICLRAGNSGEVKSGHGGRAGL